MQSKKRNPEAALTIPPPGKYESTWLKYLIETNYLSLETVTFEFDEIPTPEFAKARRAVAESEIKTPLHADLKAVATWYLQQLGCTQLTYEHRYPQTALKADVASVPKGYYAEVGQVEDVRRVYQVLGLDVVTHGSEVSSVLRRYPKSDDPTCRGGTQLVLSVPFPVDDLYTRAWELDELSVHHYARGSQSPTTPNRRHPWWGE
jgi:hypothetical protein